MEKKSLTVEKTGLGAASELFSAEAGLCFLEATTKPMELCGMVERDQDGGYLRLPQTLLLSLNDELRRLAHHMAGTTLRFRTNSPYMAIKATLWSTRAERNMTYFSNYGMDIYIGKGAARHPIQVIAPPIPIAPESLPPFPKSLSYEELCYFPKGECEADGFYDVTLNLPIYNGVTELLVGFNEGSELLPPRQFRYKNVVFYGSSITQGSAASRPGLTYPAILSRRLDCGITNLGFSGAARGEIPLAEYIATLEMEVFVMDYDHNATSPGFLEETHEPFFLAFRKGKPTTPVIFVTRPDMVTSGYADSMERLAVIKKTYQNALNSGDKNVYFIDGSKFYGDVERDCCSVDGCHPNDMGFCRMADGIGAVLKKVLEA